MSLLEKISGDMKIGVYSFFRVVILAENLFWKNINFIPHFQMNMRIEIINKDNFYVRT